MKKIIGHLWSFGLFTLIWALLSITASIPLTVSAQERIGAVSFSIGTKGYIGTGIFFKKVNQYRKDFWEYDPTTDSWTQKADFGGSARGFAAGFSIGTKGYIGTGSTGTTTFMDFWEYDPATNIWTQKVNCGSIDRESAVGFSLGNKGYLGTGYKYVNGILQNLQDFWEYDPATDSWSQIPDFPGGGRYAAAGFGIGTKGYVGTGLCKTADENFLWFNDFFEYDQATGSWSQKEAFGGTARGFSASFSVGNKGYIATGNCTSGLKKDLWEYDPISDSWSQKADLGGVPRSCATGFCIGTEGYLGTGLKSQNQYLADFWEYNPANNAWTQKTDLGKKHKGPLKEFEDTSGRDDLNEPSPAVYPNPSNSTFTFILPAAGMEKVSIQILDLSGRSVMELHGLEPGQTIVTGEGLESGVYIARIVQGTVIKSVRIARVN